MYEEHTEKKPGQAALSCIEDCEKLITSISQWDRKALELYDFLSNQVLVAGMGEIIGINHLAVHEYLRLLEYTPFEHRMVFQRILQIEGATRTELAKYKKIS